MPKDRDDNDHDDKRLAEAIEALTCELSLGREAFSAQVVTRTDLHAAEARIVAAFRNLNLVSPEDQKLLDALSVRTERTTKKLEALDAKTP